MYDTIFHLSDIHIRLFSRRQEYELVFSKLYELLRHYKQTKPRSIIIVTGDILHNKIDLQPECMLLTYDFIKNLGMIFPTILIAGNHDALLNNRDRIDSITSILHDRIPSNVTYLDKTGIFTFENLHIVLNSLLEDKPWMTGQGIIKTSPHDKIIGLYHGAIRGWKNNHGFQSESGEHEVSDFEGCDLVLLGDIHKHQYMDEEKRMAYAGSLISQNFGETDDLHGVLVWDLLTSTSHLIPIENPYAFKEYYVSESLPLQFRDHHSSTWVSLKELHPPSLGNCKLIVRHSDPIVLKELTTSFKRQYPHVKFHIKSQPSLLSTPTLEAPATDILHHDEAFILQYLEERWKNEDSNLVEMIKKELLHDFHHSGQQYVQSTLHWEIEWIRFDHLFGYGKGNVIEFHSMPRHTVTGIFGKNSAGKSTLIDVICFLLYDKITRASHGNSIPREVIHFSEKEAYGEICIRYGDCRYMIRKTCKRVQDKIKITQTYDQIDSFHQKIELTDEQRKRTDKKIQEMIGSFKGFLYTNFFLQQKEESFRDMKQAARKDFLYDLFGLDWFETYRKQKDDEWKLYKGQEKVLGSRISDDTLESWTTRLSQLQDQVQVSSNTLGQLETSLQDYQTQKMNWYEKKQSCRFSTWKSILQRESQLQHTSYIVLMEELEKEKKELESTLHECMVMDEESSEQHPLVRQYGPMNPSNSIDTWKKTFQEIEGIISQASLMTQQWKEKETSYQQQLNEYMTSKPSFDPTLCDDVQDWTEYTRQYQNMTKLRDTRENEWNELQHTITSCQPIHILEDKVQLFQDAVHQFEVVSGQYNMMKHSHKDQETIEYNPTCSQCMKHPHYVQRQENQRHYEMMSRQYYECDQACQRSWNEMECSFSTGSWRDKLKHIQGILKQEKKTLQQRQQRLQELYQWREKESQVRVRYQHTKQRRLASRLDKKMDQLKKQHIHEQQEYQQLLHYIEDYSIYQLIDTQWKQRRVSKAIYQQYQHRLEEIETEWTRCHQDMIDTKVELQQLQQEKLIWNQNHTIDQELNHLESSITTTQIKYETHQQSHKQMEFQLQQTTISFESWKKDFEQWKQIQIKCQFLKLLVSSIERDGLPLYLLKRKLPMMEENVNELLSPFLDKKLVLTIQDKDIVVGIGTQTTTMSRKTTTTVEHISNYLGGMESFIIDLSLKLAFSKFANIPRSNFFMIDEGISVMDQERIHNISHLFDFLSNITDHVLLISHIPTVKDFVHQSIEILKNPSTSKSQLILC